MGDYEGHWRHQTSCPDLRVSSYWGKGGQPAPVVVFLQLYMLKFRQLANQACPNGNPNRWQSLPLDNANRWHTNPAHIGRRPENAPIVGTGTVTPAIVHTIFSSPNPSKYNSQVRPSQQLLAQALLLPYLKQYSL